MTPARPRISLARTILCLAALALPGCVYAQMSLYTTVDLALRNNSKVRIAMADEAKARGLLAQAKDVYIPNLVFGSSLGGSYGFPLGQPSLYNLGSQSLIFNFSQLDYVRAARAGILAAQLTLKDVQQQVTEDAALNYIELDKALKTQLALEQQSAYANSLVSITQQRVGAGLDKKMDLTVAQLTAARLHLKQLQVQDDIASLRDHLARATGLNASDFVTEPSSIPTAPDFAPMLAFQNGSNREDKQSTMLSPGIQAAYAAAKSKRQTAFGDARQLMRPEFDFGAQYSRYATFNNYQLYYNHFQQNNAAIAVQITVPIFDAVRKARAAQSAADATHAELQADALRNQISEATLKMRHGLDELMAQEAVSRLEQEYAQDQLDGVLLQIKNGSGVPDAPALTPKDEQAARIEERQKYIDLLEVQFSLFHARLDLLKATGGLENWVKASSPGPARP